MVGGSKGQILIGVQCEYHMFPLLRASPLPFLICHVLIWRKMEERGDVRPQSLPMRFRKVLWAFSSVCRIIEWITSVTDGRADAQIDRRTEERTVRDRIRLILFTNRKSHAGLRLLPKSMTLNYIERRNDLRPVLSLR